MKRWKTAFAAGIAAVLLAAGLLLAGCSDSGGTTSSGLESDNWIGEEAAVELLEGLTQEETVLSLPTEYYLFEPDEEVGDIGEVTCYIIHAYLVEDETGQRYLEDTLYVAVDGSQVYVYDLNNDAFNQVWGDAEETSQTQSETNSQVESE